MNAQIDTPQPFRSRSEEDLYRLDMQGAQLMFEFVEQLLGAGQRPPKVALKWYAETLIYRLCYYEEYILDRGSRLPKEEYEKRYAQLTDLVARVSAAFALLSAEKEFVMLDELQGPLRVRKLYLPTGFDATYGNLIP